MRRRVFALCLPSLLWASAGKAEEKALYVTLTSPTPGAPLFGEAVVEAQVDPVDALDTLDVFVDGEFITRLRRPPFRVTVQVGQENTEHRFEVVARGEGWEPGQALLLTRPLGSGILLAANMQGAARGDWIDDLLDTLAISAAKLAAPSTHKQTA